MSNKRKHRINASEKKGLRSEFVLEDVHLYRLNRHTFTIYVGGDPSAQLNDDNLETGVEYQMADRFERNLGILSGIDPNRPILVEMTSCGGYWEEGMQMYGGILACPNPITVVATKWARSMTSIIPLAADRFIIRPPGQYMFHCGSYGFSGLSQEADTDDVQRRIGVEQMYRIYVARLKEQGKFMKRSETSIRKMLEENVRNAIDVWLSADEAKEWGFVDDVFDGKTIIRATCKNMARRKRMLAVLRRPVNVQITVT